MTYIWSDTHFNHKNIIQYANRPFGSVEEMNKAMIDAWKQTVRPKDTIIHLGDVGFGPAQFFKELIPTLPGKKILILGNHDKGGIRFWRNAGFHEVYPYPIIYQEWLILSHKTVFLNEQLPYLNLHGHIHQHKMESKCYINVSVEQIRYKPVLLTKIVDEHLKAIGGMK